MKERHLRLVLVCFLITIVGGCSEDDPTSGLSAPTPIVVTGKVIDAMTRIPLVGVSISTTPPTTAVVSDSLGNFTISNVDTGSYKLQASRSGYFNGHISITLGRGQSLQVVIPMVAGGEGDDLVAWYPFEGNADDQSGNGHNGTINGAIFTTDRFNQPSRALKFDGRSYVEVPHSPDLNFGTSVDFTIGAWVRFSSTQPDFAGIVSKMVSGLVDPFAGYQLVIRNFNDGGVLVVDAPGAQVETTIARNDITVKKSKISDGQWHYLTLVVYRSVQQANLYLDGVLKLSYASTSFHGSLDNDEPLRIGVDRNSQRYFAGSIDDVRIYKRALSPAEVRVLAEQ